MYLCPSSDVTLVSFSLKVKIFIPHPVLHMMDGLSKFELLGESAIKLNLFIIFSNYLIFN